MIYQITARALDESFLRTRVYPDRRQTLYWSDSWDPDFYVALARAGFISISYDHPQHGPLLFVELHRSSAVLDWKDLHVSRNLRRLLRSERLESEGVELRVVDPCERVLARLGAHHGPTSWLIEPYRSLVSALASQARSDFAIHGVELWSRTRDELVAGELGYSIGRSYTSLSGFCSPQDRSWRDFGALQLVMLAELLREQGYAFWNLGNPSMAYKGALGARLTPRNVLLRRWFEARDALPARPLAGASRAGSGLLR